MMRRFRILYLALRILASFLDSCNIRVLINGFYRLILHINLNTSVIKLNNKGVFNHLINDVAVCETADGTALDCLGVMSTSSKSDVRLFK